MAGVENEPNIPMEVLSARIDLNLLEAGIIGTIEEILDQDDLSEEERQAARSKYLAIGRASYQAARYDTVLADGNHVLDYQEVD